MLQNEEFTVYSDYAENYMEAVMMVDKLVNRPGAPEYLGVSWNHIKSMYIHIGNIQYMKRVDYIIIIESMK